MCNVIGMSFPISQLYLLLGGTLKYQNDNDIPGTPVKVVYRRKKLEKTQKSGIKMVSRSAHCRNSKCVKLTTKMGQIWQKNHIFRHFYMYFWHVLSAFAVVFAQFLSLFNVFQISTVRTPRNYSNSTFWCFFQLLTSIHNFYRGTWMEPRLTSPPTK